VADWLPLLFCFTILTVGSRAGLVSCEPVGRHRYYQLSSEKVARAIESLGILSEFVSSANIPNHQGINKQIKYARTCYDHLAGELGIKLAKCLIANNVSRKAR